MSNITIEVEFLAGTDIRSAIGEAKIKASLWNVAYVCFNFNGVNVSVSHKADVDDMVERYHVTFKSKLPFVVG